MQITIEKQSTDQILRNKPQLFQVWIDVNCGYEPAEWELNSYHLPPKLLQFALDEAAECRRMHFPAKVMPEGVSPRLDGTFD